MAGHGKTGTFWTLLLTSAITVPSVQLAQPAGELRPLLQGNWPASGLRGSANDVKLIGSTAYVAYANAGLLMVDVSNPTNCVQLANYDTFNATGIAIAGKTIFLADGCGGGLLAFHADSPAHCTREGGWNSFNNCPPDVALMGQYACLASWFAGLTVVDVSSPTNCQFVSSLDTAGTANYVTTSGNYAYISDTTEGLVIIDLSNPASPVRAGTYPVIGRAFVTNGRAYIARGTTGIEIADVSVPSNCYRLGGYDTTGTANAVTVVGNLAYVADGSAGLQVIDVSNPASCVRRGGVDTPGGCLKVEVVGTMAYVADGDSGLRTVDISNPAAPRLIGGIGQNGSGHRIAVSGKYAFLADYKAGLQVIDVEDPGNPIHVGNYDTPGQAMDVALAGNYAYVADGGTLQIINLNNLSSPSFAGNYSLSGIDLRGVQVRGNYAYAADRLRGLRIVNVQNPASCTLVATVTNASSETWKVALEGNRAYTTYTANGGSSYLKIVDISDPGVPLTLGTVGTYNRGEDIVVSNSIAYVAANLSGLRIFDASDPTNGVFLGDYKPGVSAIGVALNSHYAYVAFSGGTMHIVDIANPAQPTLVKICKTRGSTARHVCVAGNRVYVAHSEGGLLALGSIPMFQFMVRVSGYPADSFHLDSTPNISDSTSWSTLLVTNPPDGVFEFTDFDVTSHRFYRAMQP